MDAELEISEPLSLRSSVVVLFFHITFPIACFCAQPRQVTATDSPIDTAASAKVLPASEAAHKLPVALHGVVTAVPEGWKGFFLEDATGGIYCEPQNTEAEKSFWPVTVGEEMELQGVTAPGHRNSFVAVTKITSRKSGTLPQPTLRTIQSVILDRVDADFVRLRGHIIDLVNIAGEMEYGLYADGIEAEVVHAGFRIDPKIYEHSEVEICGVVIPQQGSARPVKIVVPNADSFRMLATHLEVIESTKLSPIESVLRQFQGRDPTVRISGDVYGSNPDEIWLVDKGFGIKWVAKGIQLPKGTKHVELLGIVKGKDANKSIEYGTVLSTSDVPSRYGFTPALIDDRVNGHLNQIVNVKATFWDSNLINSERILSFDLGNAKLTCRVLEETHSANWTNFRRGAIYSVNGLLTHDSIENSAESAIVLRSLKDVVMVTGPPWSVRFTLYVVSLLSGALTIGLLTTMYCWQQTTVARRRLESARNDLCQVNETLEVRVVERTTELDKINRKLIDEASARLLVERDQRQTLESLEDAQSLAQIGSFVWNAASNISTWSKQCFLVHGLSAGESAPTLDQYCIQVYDEDRWAFKRYLEKATNSIEREEFRYRITLASGELRWVRSLVKVVKSAGGALIAIEGIVQNVTEQVSAEQQLRHSVKMEVAGHLAGGIAHDLNNTLLVVKLNCYLLTSKLEKQSLDSGLAAHVEDIEAAANKSAMLTSQLLTFSRKQVIRPVILNVNATILSFKALLSQLLEDRVVIKFDLAEQTADVRLDQGQLEQLLMNLILNARDAISGSGLIRITTSNVTVNCNTNVARWALQPKCGEYVSLIVSDNGSGIPPELLHKIFEPFFSTKLPEKGTGLGLAVVHGIIRQNSGGLMVENQPNRGTTFKLLIPRAAKADDANDSGSSLLNDHFNSTQKDFTDFGGGQSILLVEDELSVCEHTRQVLNRLGFNVTALNSPSDALALVEEHCKSFQLLLTDYSMPHMSGVELATEIRKHHPTLPVVIMSGFINEEAFQSMPDGQAPVFLQKPFAVQDLGNAIQKALRHSSIIKTA